MKTLLNITIFLFKWLFFASCLIVVTSFPSIILEFTSLKDEFSEHGIRTAGRVVDSTYASTCFSEEPSCKPIVEFTNGKGETKRFTDIDTATYAGFPVGSQVEVEYLPNQNDQARIYIPRDSRAGYDLKVQIVLWGVWLFFCVLLFLFVHDYIFSPLRARLRGTKAESEASQSDD